MVDLSPPGPHPPSCVYDQTVTSLGIVDIPRGRLAQRPLPSRLPPPPTPSVPADPHSRSDAVRTTVSNLKNVSRIRSSKGLAGRSRTSQHISGLMFHFRDTERVAIVAQWIEEVDFMDIDEGDHITHIRISYCFDGEQHPGDHVPSHCNVTSFAVSTLRGIRKDVCRSESRVTYYRNYYTNALEEIVGSLVDAAPV